jgi:hypothetical protein
LLAEQESKEGNVDGGRKRAHWMREMIRTMLGYVVRRGALDRISAQRDPALALIET